MLFVGQSVFGAKQAVLNGGVPVGRAHEFAARMLAAWRVLAPSLGEEHQRDDPYFAGWVFHPILDGDEGGGSPKLTRTLEERLAWWTQLRSLATAIVREGPSREVSSLFHHLKDSPLLAGVDGGDLVDLFAALAARTESLASPLGYHWDDGIASAAGVIETISGRTTDVAIRDRLYGIVAAWAAPPLSNDKAGAIAKRLRW